VLELGKVFDRDRAADLAEGICRQANRDSFVCAEPCFVRHQLRDAVFWQTRSFDVHGNEVLLQAVEQVGALPQIGRFARYVPNPGAMNHCAASVRHGALGAKCENNARHTGGDHRHRPNFGGLFQEDVH
jgi:hypothetical protein